MDEGQFLIDESFSVLQAMERINQNAKKIVFVVENQKLLASLTDGDIRRYILKGGNLSNSVQKIANYQPKFLTNIQTEDAKKILKKSRISCVPIVNEKKEIVSLVFEDDSEIVLQKINLSVVIMAGGLGTRLYPYTKILPKPLIPIGDIPIVEHIMNRLYKYGCKDYYLIVNYKKNMIKAYFNETKTEFAVNYVDEDKPLGTGGGLSLLRGKLNSTFIFTNCDVLLDADFTDIFRYHRENKNLITMVCAIKNVTIPYGVIGLDQQGNISNMTEKPKYSFLTNTGIYLVEPEVIDEIQPEMAIGFPDVIEKLRKAGKKIGVYPVGEQQWMDMGQIEELDEMRKRLGV